MAPCFVAAFSALAGKHHGSGAELPRLLDPICEEMRLAELQSAHRVQVSDTGGCIAGQGLPQPGDAFLNASRARVDMPQGRLRDRSQVGDFPLLGQSDRTFERDDRLDEISAEAFEASEVQGGPDEAEGVIEYFSEPDSLLSMVASLVEHSEFGEGARQKGARHHPRICNESKTLARQTAGQRLYQCPAEAFGFAIVARAIAQPDAVVPAGNLERDIMERRADGLGLFGEHAHVARATTRVQVKAAHVARHRSQSAPIIQLLGESFSFPEILFDLSPFHQREQSVSKVEAKIDPLLQALASHG